MSWPSLTSVFRSTSFRLTFGFAALFCGVLLAVLLGWGWTSVILIERELGQEVTELSGELQALHRDRGLDALTARVAAMARQAEDSGVFSHLQGGDGTKLAGDLDWPQPQTGWIVMASPYDEDEDLTVSLGTALGDGSMLLVAVDAEEAYDRRELLSDGAFWVAVVTLPLAALSGWLMSAVVLRRIAGITLTAGQIAADNQLGRRIALNGSGDEFDGLARRLNVMLESIEDLTRNIRHVSAGIAHDLRTPLTRLRNSLSEFARLPETSKRQSDSVDTMVEDMDAVLATFDAMLRIAQIDSGTRRSQFQELDLAALVRDVVETYEPVAEADGRKLSARIAEPARISGDAELLTQLIVNLIENALQHTPPGTPVNVVLALDGSDIRLEIADRGQGIEPCHRDRAFEHFYRNGERPTKAQSGLGLSLVRAIAKLHGVQPILADNKPGLSVAMTFQAVQ